MAGCFPPMLQCTWDGLQQATSETSPSIFTLSGLYYPVTGCTQPVLPFGM